MYIVQSVKRLNNGIRCKGLQSLLSNLGLTALSQVSFGNNYYNIIIEFKINYIICIQLANSICQKAVRVVLASKVNYPISCNPIKDIMVSFDGT